VLRQYFGFLPSVDKIINASLEVLKQQGAILIDPVVIDTLNKLNDPEEIVLGYELKAGMAAYLAHRGNGTSFHTLKDLIDFNESHAENEMTFFGQELFLKAESRGPLTDSVYREALEKNHRMSREEGIDAVMNKHKLDAIVFPTDSPAWVTDLVNGDHYMSGSPQLAAVAGYPHITVPAGNVFGLPVGISFIGRAWSEPALLKIAYSFEQATHARKPPKFLPTVKFT
jgi:amidase